MSRVGVLPLARATFDVPFAEEMAARAFAAFAAAGIETAGPRELLFDEAATRQALAEMPGDLNLVVIMQVTFADASPTAAIGAAVEAPLVLWAFPEERTGGRLRLNSFCGINLGGHALAKAGRPYRWLYAPPEEAAAVLGAPAATPAEPGPVPPTRERPAARAAAVADQFAATRVGVVGRHPDGFVPCEYDPDRLRALTGVEVYRIELEEMFARGRGAPAGQAAAVRARAATFLAGIDDVDQVALDRTMRLYPALRDLADERGLAGLAVRCWPECFTEYGGAHCGAASLMNEDLVPAACEADVYGSITALALQWLTGSPALVADLVDVDVAGGTGVLWHCGKAPPSMADPESTPVATIHSNRKLPLLAEFPFKPGRVTIARLSQAGGSHKLVVGGGEMVRAPLPFSGTAGVVRFDRPAGEVLATIMGEGLEHHYGFAYGDVREELWALAARWAIPVVTL